MTKDQIEQLADRIASGEADDSEILLYNRLYNFLSSGGADESYFDQNRLELEKEIKKGIWKKTGLSKPVVRQGWFRWSVAASLIFCVSFSFWIVKNKNARQEIASISTQKARYKNDVTPGQQGAILILSNGKTIVLDSAHNGSLVQEGATEVIKKNGEVVYASQEGVKEMTYNTMTTPKGRQYTLVLADGSKVWLNAASSITFPTAFIGKERRVTLTGEAYFEIAHNDELPFIVQKGAASIKVLGTHFNVNSYEDERSLNVTLLEGSVAVANGTMSRLIRPGQQARLHNSDIQVINQVDTDGVMAWKSGLFHFEGIDIESLMRQLSRWYNIEVVYETQINDTFYAEMPRNTSLSDVLKFLELTGKVHFGIDGNKVTVMP